MRPRRQGQPEGGDAGERVEQVGVGPGLYQHRLPAAGQAADGTGPPGGADRHALGPPLLHIRGEGPFVPVLGGDGEAAVTGTWDPEKEEWVYILDEDTPLANMDATPPTGDPSLTGLWALLNGLSLTGVAAVLTGFRRKKKDD